MLETSGGFAPGLLQEANKKNKGSISIPKRSMGLGL